MNQPPVCDYEGSDYQKTFWDSGGREYEDQSEALAIRRLLPKKGRLLLEVGAGAGRNTLRYAGYDRIVLLDYSLTQLQQARERLGGSGRFLYVAANVYQLPFVAGLFDSATMIRTLHHLADPPLALREIHRVLEPNAAFLLEFANKLNLKSIVRFLAGRQSWSPFSHDPVEYLPLNFDFHPATHPGVAGRERVFPFSARRPSRISESDGSNERSRPRFWPGWIFYLGIPGDYSSFRRACFFWPGPTRPSRKAVRFFSMPALPEFGFKGNGQPGNGYLQCGNCRTRFPIRNGIYDFKESVPG